MEPNKFIALLKNKKQTVFAIVLLCFLFSGIFTVIKPFAFKTESKVLVYQDNTDPYAMAKSGQYLSNLMVNIIKTGSFYEEVLKSGFNIDVLYFSSNDSDRVAIWRDTVETAVVDDSGVFSITVFHTDKYQSNQIAQAINYVIKTKHNQYHGAGDKVMVKIIDSPVTSNFPVRPRFVFNFLAGIFSGLILSIVYIYLFPEPRFDIRVFPKKKENEKAINLSLKKSNEQIEEEIENARNAEKIRRDIERVLEKTQFEIERKKREELQAQKSKEMFARENNKSNIVRNEVGVVDIEEIEEEGSIHNIIGFSKLGN